MTKIAVLVGSLRKESFSKQLAENIMTLFPKGYDAEIIPLGDLPMYNQDFDAEGEVPEATTNFRNKMKEMDAVLFVTPEYNRSIPAVLKNAVDTGSRPKPESVWNGKPGLIVSNSPGHLSGFGANHHLRQSLSCLNMPLLQQPEVYLANVKELLGENGKIEKTETVEFLQSVVDGFVQLINMYEAQKVSN